MMPMDTTDDAAYYQAHKDDADEWGEPEPVTARGQALRLASIVSVRLTVDQESRVRAAARRRGQTLSAYLRESALQQCDRDVPRISNEPTTSASAALSGPTEFNAPGEKVEAPLPPLISNH